MRGFFFDREIVYQALGVFGLESNNAGEFTLEVRIICIEPFGNVLGMSLVFGKEDGLSKAVAASDFQATFHHVGKYFVHGVPVKQPFVDGFGFYPFRDFSVFIPPVKRFPLLFVFIGELVVIYPLALELKGH